LVRLPSKTLFNTFWDDMITVGLLWHSVNSDNLGIGALTASNIAIVEAAAKAQGEDVAFCVLGWRDPGPAQISRPDVQVKQMRARDLIDPRSLYSWVRTCDFVLDISAGDSFADIYGARRFKFNILSKLAVLAARRPLVLSPQTLGPFERRWARLAATALMRRARAVVTRDNLSTAYVKPLGVEGVIEATDVAFRLPYKKPEGKRGGRVKVGINISGLLFNGGYTRDNMFALKTDYPVLARSLVSHFAGLPECEVHLVGHVNSERFATDDDYRVAELLAAEFPGVVLAPRFATPSDAKSYIAGLDFFCGSRMHACIAAFSSGVPVVPIAYSRKFAGLFGSLGYTAVADCKSETAAEIMSKVAAGYDGRAGLMADAERGRALAEAKLLAYEDLLRQCIREARDRRR
jgi:colanic acid/amylovoran biosynthesis protein